MRIATVLIQNAIRLIGLTLTVLGFLFWSHRALNLIPLHMRLGETLCGLLWVSAILGMVARLNPILTIGAILWGLLVVVFGMNMGKLLPGSAHEAVRVLHFLLGLAAIALSESLSARIKRKLLTA